MCAKLSFFFGSHKQSQKLLYSKLNYIGQKHRDSCQFIMQEHFLLKNSPEKFADIKKSRTFALEIKKQHRGVEQLVARWAHNPKVVCSSQASATRKEKQMLLLFYFLLLKSFIIIS